MNCRIKMDKIITNINPLGFNVNIYHNGVIL